MSADIFINPYGNNISVSKNTAIFAIGLKFGLGFWFWGGEMAWWLGGRNFLESQAKNGEE